MRTLIATAFVSLDGVIEAPGGEPGYRNSGWTFNDIDFDEAAYEIKGREQGEATAMMSRAPSRRSKARTARPARAKHRSSARRCRTGSRTAGRTGSPCCADGPVPGR